MKLGNTISSAPSLTQKSILLKTIGLGIISILGTYLRLPIPWSPIPITLQPLPSFIAGSLLGPWYGLASQFLYLLGLPLSYYNVGYTPLTGPIAGYLWGISLSACFVGLLSRQTRIRSSFLYLFISLTIIHIACVLLPGTLWLSVWYSANHSTIPFSTLIWQSIIPFIWGDLIKISIATQLLLQRPLEA